MVSTFKTMLTGLAASGIAVLAAAPGQAATFTSFFFETTWLGSPPEGDVLLESVSYDGSTVTDFELVTGATIEANEPYDGGDTGALSTDHGTETVPDPLVGEGPAVEDPTDADVVAALGNLNLNSIIDTEDDGEATLMVTFDAPTSTFLFWERGMNSDLLVEAIDGDGMVIATYEITRSMFSDAGFSITTTEIVDTASPIQKVGSLGLKLNDASVSALRLSNIASFNGPDYKVLAVKEVPTDIPEPAALLGLGLVAGVGAFRLRRRQQA